MRRCGGINHALFAFAALSPFPPLIPQSTAICCLQSCKSLFHPDLPRPLVVSGVCVFRVCVWGGVLLAGLFKTGAGGALFGLQGSDLQPQKTLRSSYG